MLFSANALAQFFKICRAKNIHLRTVNLLSDTSRDSDAMLISSFNRYAAIHPTDVILLFHGCRGCLRRLLAESSFLFQ